MSKIKPINATVGAFVINNEATYPWVVYVYVPNEKGGSKLKVKFKATFKHLSSDRRVEILEEFRQQLESRKDQNSPQDDDQVDNAKSAVNFEALMLKEVVVGFSGIKTPSGEDFVFSEENLDTLLNNAWARDAMTHAFLNSLKGRSDEGN